MHYLSVHDLYWINSTVTGNTPTFDYQRLEAAVAAQYGYGNSTNVAAQAATFLESLVRRPSFESGNLRAAFIAVCTFLNANGYTLRTDASSTASIVRSVASGERDGPEAIQALAQTAEIGLRPGFTLRQLVTYLFNEHTDTLQHLTEGDQ